MVKKLFVSVITAIMMTTMTFNSYAYAEDNLSVSGAEVIYSDDSYTVVVTNDGLDDVWISRVNFNYDLVWTISGNNVSCQSDDGSVNFNAEIHDDTLYVDGTDFLFAVCEIPNIANEEDEGCSAMFDWVLKLHDVKTIVFSDSVENLEMFSSSAFFANVENIDFGDSLKRIGENNVGIFNVKNTEFPETLKELGGNSFRNCIYLKKIVLPSGLEKIGENAFYGCSELKDITVLSKGIELSNSGIGYSRSGELLSDVIIQGYSGSTAEAYATENGFNFVPLDEEPVTTTSTSTEMTTTTTTTDIGTSSTSTSAEITSSNISENTVVTSSNTTTTEKSSTKEDSPKTQDKGIIGIGITMLSALGLLCISKRKR
ncbi:MAG: leucine-rich repeat domain-containing protein [Ruminococcus flavefaciens]|nr:leucine-rich repeat domain-containing protein [Ruminococcus flavefaciens]